MGDPAPPAEDAENAPCCAICFSAFDLTPRAACGKDLRCALGPCGHPAACVDCTTTMANAATDRYQVNCPVCRALYTLSEAGVVTHGPVESPGDVLTIWHGLNTRSYYDVLTSEATIHDICEDFCEDRGLRRERLELFWGPIKLVGGLRIRDYNLHRAWLRTGQACILPRMLTARLRPVRFEEAAEWLAAQPWTGTKALASNRLHPIELELGGYTLCVHFLPAETWFSFLQNIATAHPLCREWDLGPDDFTLEVDGIRPEQDTPLIELGLGTAPDSPRKCEILVHSAGVEEWFKELRRACQAGERNPARRRTVTVNAYRVHLAPPHRSRAEYARAVVERCVRDVPEDDEPPSGTPHLLVAPEVRGPSCGVRA